MHVGAGYHSLKHEQQYREGDYLHFCVVVPQPGRRRCVIRLHSNKISQLDAMHEQKNIDCNVESFHARVQP